MSERLKIPKKRYYLISISKVFFLMAFLTRILAVNFSDDEMNFRLSLKKCPQTLSNLFVFLLPCH